MNWIIGENKPDYHKIEIDGVVWESCTRNQALAMTGAASYTAFAGPNVHFFSLRRLKDNELLGVVYVVTHTTGYMMHTLNGYITVGTRSANVYKGWSPEGELEAANYSWQGAFTPLQLARLLTWIEALAAYCIDAYAYELDELRQAEALRKAEIRADAIYRLREIVKILEEYGELPTEGAYFNAVEWVRNRMKEAKNKNS